MTNVKLILSFDNLKSLHHNCGAVEGFNDGESFKILLSKGEKFDIAATTDGSTIVELPSLPIILVPVPIRTLLKDLQWTCEMTGLGTALLVNLVLFFCVKSFCSKCFRHILGPFALTIFGRSIFNEVIHL